MLLYYFYERFGFFVYGIDNEMDDVGVLRYEIEVKIDKYFDLWLKSQVREKDLFHFWNDLWESFIKNVFKKRLFIPEIIMQ